MFKNEFDQFIDDRLGYFADVKADLKAARSKTVSINKIPDQDIYCMELTTKWNAKECFLLGNVEGIRFADVIEYLPEHCMLISYFPIEGRKCTGKKRIYLSPPKKRCDQVTKPDEIVRKLSINEDIHDILPVLERNDDSCPLPDYEEWMRVQVRNWATVSNSQHDFDLWGLYESGELLALVRIDTICEGQEQVVRSIGVFTKESFRNMGVAYTLISAVIAHYRNEKIIWRYEVEEENIASIKLAQKLGFIYEGNTYCYIY